MMVYPTLEVQAGKVVSLTRGRMDSPSVWHVDPVQTVRDWASAGASWIHVTDFDAIEGDERNESLIEALIRSARIPVQLGGGMRSEERVAHWIDKGVGRVVVGTLGVQSPDDVMGLAKYYPDQIVLSVDVFQGRVMTEGWRKDSAIDPRDLISAYADAPLAGLIITDIDSDIEDTEARMGVIAALSEAARAPVIASGVVRSSDDIARLKYIPGVDGVLIGRALFNKSVDLKDALAVAQPETDHVVADFI
ncbi:MAG: 1-(5-phosphoribosyl)-5-[(5-phosphoribosylamino)methylideneamino] imidazole-4-carboxamide isomerase [Paracoccaceae bacterium]